MNLDELNNNEILSILQKKGRYAEKAFRLIYERYSSRIMSFCKNMLKNNTIAEDIFQETFIRFYNNAAPKDREISILSYLYTIARNLCYDHFRVKQSHISIDSENINYIENLIVDNDNSIEYENKFELMLDSMEKLSPTDKEMLILRVFEKLSYQEIADILDTNEANARKKTFRAKLRLKEIIDQYYLFMEK